MSDVVNHPSHYKVNGLEVIDICEAFDLNRDAYLFNVVTYILRAGRKGDAAEDLRKALNYLHRRVHGRWIHETGHAPLYYLATPYTKYSTGIEEAFAAAASLAARLLRKGIEVYSPIAHCHPMAVHGNLDAKNHDLWLPYQEAMMRRCDALLVANLNGWRESKGVAHEIEFFKYAGKPLHMLALDTLVMTPFQHEKQTERQ